jgi:hypothetical protein
MEQENLNKGIPLPEAQQPAPDIKAEAKKEPPKSVPKRELTTAQMPKRTRIFWGTRF